MKLKENFTQAAKEVLMFGTERENQPEANNAQKPVEKEQPRPIYTEKETKVDEQAEALKTLLAGKPAASPAPAPVKTIMKPSAAPAVSTASSTTTVIGEGTTITGNIESTGSIELYGAVNGNVTSKAGLRISGRLAGDAAAANVEVQACHMKGNIMAEKNIQIDRESVIVGNVVCDTLTLGGKLKGDLTVHHALVLESSAALIGNASAASISIQPGAIFQGEMKITSSEVDKMFKDM